MIKRVMPYAPYIVVIISLIVAIVMVVTLNGQNQHKASKKTETGKVATKTAGDATNDSGPTYTVRANPAPQPSISTPKPVTPPVPTPKTASKPSPASTIAATATAVAASKNTDLANTGPGETIALFALSVLAAAGVHSFYIRKKLEA